MTPTNTNHHRRRAVLLGLAAAPSLLLVACSDDAEADAACEPYLAITEQFNAQEPDPAAVSGLLDDLEAEIPEDLDESLPVMIDGGRKAVDGDFSAFESPEFLEAQGEVDPWMFDNCEFEQTEEVTAKEYEFEGLEDEYDAGELGILFTNDGEEAHELAIMKKADGVTESWDEILALPQEEGEALVEQVGSTFAPRKGTQGLGVVQLTAGDYVALCFVPTGTTMAADGSFTEGEGVPHFMGGMKHEFTVSA